jgi:hypothetical protein
MAWIVVVAEPSFAGASDLLRDSLYPPGVIVRAELRRQHSSDELVEVRLKRRQDEEKVNAKKSGAVAAEKVQQVGVCVQTFNGQILRKAGRKGLGRIEAVGMQFVEDVKEHVGLGDECFANCAVEVAFDGALGSAQARGNLCRRHTFPD